jgi:hypothetical protein
LKLRDISKLEKLRGAVARPKEEAVKARDEAIMEVFYGRDVLWD